MQPICDRNANTESVHFVVVIYQALAVAVKVLNITLQVRIVEHWKTPAEFRRALVKPAFQQVPEHATDHVMEAETELKPQHL